MSIQSVRSDDAGPVKVAVSANSNHLILCKRNRFRFEAELGKGVVASCNQGGTSPCNALCTGLDTCFPLTESFDAVSAARNVLSKDRIPEFRGKHVPVVENRVRRRTNA